MTLRAPPDLVAETFGLSGAPAIEPRFNIAPTQPILTVVRNQSGRREAVELRWGLIPPWAKAPNDGMQINARAETLDSKPAFREAFRRRRCLVVADGFYEWKTLGPKDKVPMFIRRADDAPLAFAGLWGKWRSQAGEWIESCAVVTCAPNELVAELHDRMPAILPADAWDVWLDPSIADPDLLQSMLGPYPADELTIHPVSRYVNKADNEGPECIEPAPGASAPPQSRLPGF